MEVVHPHDVTGVSVPAIRNDPGAWRGVPRSARSRRGEQGRAEQMRSQRTRNLHDSGSGSGFLRSLGADATRAFSVAAGAGAPNAAASGYGAGKAVVMIKK